MDATIGWTALTIAALCAGFAKTAVGGLGVVSVALGTLVLPASEATAAILLLLIIGDLVAVTRYRRDADWSVLVSLVPAVLPGLALGSVLLALLPDPVLQRAIGLLLLLLFGLQVRPIQWRPQGWTAAGVTGAAAGATTMVANAGGPVMTLYLLATGVDKRTFLGTSAVFFAGVNLCKVPFLIGLDLIDGGLLRQTMVLAPAVLLGSLVGIAVVDRLCQEVFDRAVLAAAALSAAALLVL